MMRVLITGVTGFVGPYLASRLALEDGLELFGMMWSGGQQGQQNGAADLPPQLRILEGDVTDDSSIRTVLEEARPDLVFHLAGASSGAVAWHHPAACLEVNAVGTLRLLDGIRQRGRETTCVVASSGEIYGGAASEIEPLTEDAPLRPLSPYAVSKAAQDLVAFQFGSGYGMRVIRLRLFNHTGPRQPPGYVASSFARQIARIERGLQPPQLEVGNLEARRDFIDVRDVVEAYWMAAQHGGPEDTFNVCSGRAVSIRQLLDLLIARARRQVALRTDPNRMRPADIPLLVGDPSRLSRATGWAPAIPLEQSVEDLLDWWRLQV